MKLETEIEVRSKNTPAITDYHHTCRKREQNENRDLINRDYNFKLLIQLTLQIFTRWKGQVGQIVCFGMKTKAE